ncbi:MAG: hypothetical protein IJ717_00965 [Treponema sp.]|nr:hypothetical protein [Treponema sp.]
MIDAEIVFNALFAGGFVHRFQWRNLNQETEKYQVSFFCEKCKLNALHCFEIYVVNGQHFIRRTELNIFLELHGIELNF